MSRKHVKNVENNRERILKIAMSLFSQKGYAATTVREIVGAASTTAPSLYYYFGSKKGLFLELLETHFQQINYVLEHFADASFESTREKIKYLISGTFVNIIKDKEFILLLNAVYYGPPNGAPFFDFDSYKTRFHNVMSRILKEGIRSGEFKKGDASDMAWVVQGVLRIAIDDQILNEPRAIDQNRLGKLLDLVLDGFENPQIKSSHRTKARNLSHK